MEPIRCIRCGAQPSISRDPFALVVQVSCPCCGAGLSYGAPDRPFTEPDPPLKHLETAAIDLWNVANGVPARV
jgi:hypothetical protein